LTWSRPLSVERIGVYGGTFDPVHIGHLRSALEARRALGLSRVLMVPAGEPVHRQPPLASGEQRRRMLELSLAGVPGLQLDDCELRRDGPSYMVDTLAAMRQQYADASLVLIVGMDAFLGLPQWHHWRRLLELAHIAVMARPGAWPPLPAELSELLAERGAPADADLPGHLAAGTAGSIVRMQLSQLEISGSGIREQIGQGADVRFLVTDAVCDYVFANRLYRSIDVGSSADTDAGPLAAAPVDGVGLQRLDHLVLTVTDIPTSVAFYRDVLGMQAVQFADGRVVLRFGPHKINLHQAGNELQPGADRATPGSADLCLLSAMDVTQLQRRLEHVGVLIELGPVVREGALGPMQSLYFRDPDRNLIELAHYPA